MKHYRFTIYELFDHDYCSYEIYKGTLIVTKDATNVRNNLTVRSIIPPFDKENNHYELKRVLRVKENSNLKIEPYNSYLITGLEHNNFNIITVYSRDGDLVTYDRGDYRFKLVNKPKTDLRWYEKVFSEKDNILLKIKDLI